MKDSLAPPRVTVRLPRVLFVLLPILPLAPLFFMLVYEADARPVAQQGGNLVLNSGFEDPSPANWWNDGSQGSRLWYAWSNGVYHSPSHSAEIGSNTSKDTGQWRSASFSVTVGVHYTFSGWIRTANVAQRAFLTLAFYSDHGGLVAEFNSSQVDNTSNWTRVASNVSAPSNASYARVYCRLVGRGVAWFDDIAVGEIPVQAPILRISKSDVPDPVRPGTSLVYTILYTNVGNLNATDVVITDSYDSHLEFDSAYPFTPTKMDNNLVWRNMGTLTPYENGLLVLTMTVDNSLPNGQVLQNRVYIDCYETGPVGASITTSITSRPHLDIIKNNYPDPVQPGGVLIYTIVYTNTGTSIAEEVDITDTLPMSVSFQSASIKPITSTYGMQVRLIWRDIGDLGIGESRTIIVTTTVSSSAQQGDTLRNLVVIECDEGERSTDENETAVIPFDIGLVPLERAGNFQPGQLACYPHKVSYGGIQPADIVITPTSSHPSWQAHAIPSLLMGVSKGSVHDIQVCVNIPPGCAATAGISDTLTITASVLSSSPPRKVIGKDITTISSTTVDMSVDPGRRTVVNWAAQYPAVFDFTHLITNNGNDFDVFAVGQLYSPTQECDQTVVGISPSMQPVEPCQPYTATVSIMVTSNRTACWAGFSVTSTHGSESRFFADELQRRSAYPRLSPGGTRTAYSGNVVTFTHFLSNAGNYADVITVSPVSLQNWEIAPSFPMTFSVAPDKSQDFVVSVTVPSLMTDTVNHITITATSAFSPTQTDVIVDMVEAAPYRVYLPLQLRDFHVFCNGGFETGNLDCWYSHGEFLRSVQSKVVHSGKYAALLGIPDTCSQEGQLGNACIEQIVNVPSNCSSILSFTYAISTYDHIRFPDGRLGDSFDVYVQDTLKWRDGYDNYPNQVPGCDSLQNLGWKLGAVDLSDYQGQSVRVLFCNVTRQDKYFNTWTYLDDVDVSCKSAAIRK